MLQVGVCGFSPTRRGSCLACRKVTKPATAVEGLVCSLILAVRSARLTQLRGAEDLICVARTTKIRSGHFSWGVV